MGYSQTIPLSSVELGSRLETAFQVTSGATVTIDFVATIFFTPWLTGRIKHAYLDMYFPYVHNSNVAANSINGDQYIQTKVGVGGTWSNAILVHNFDFNLPGSSSLEGTVRLTGNIDLQSLNIDGSTLFFRWENSNAALASLDFNCMYFILRAVTE
jgi:hypothetical protein